MTVDFDLYAAAPVPPKPKTQPKAESRPPHICGLRWWMREDGTWWAYQTNSWKDVARSGSGQLLPLGVGMKEFAKVFFDPSCGKPEDVEAAVKSIQAENRRFAAEWRKAQNGKK